MNIKDAEEVLGLQAIPVADRYYSENTVDEAFRALTTKAITENKLSLISNYTKARDELIQVIRNRDLANTSAIQVIRQSERQNVIDYLVHSQHNVLVTGPAGTGKSFLLKAFTERFGFASIAVVAPTGVAALNAGGETIHSFFGFHIGILCDDTSWIARIPERTQAKLKALELLVIDEISMANPDILDAIDLSLRSVRHSSIPFAGVRVVMFGDPLQLKPVEPNESAVKEYIKNRYGSYWFFNAHVWRDAEFQIIELQEVMRQSDPKFIRVLSEIRTNQISSEGLQLLNARLHEPSSSANPIRLVKTKKQVAEWNETELASLVGVERTFTAEETVFDSEYRRDIELPVDANLSLKIGAQVMFVKNEDAYQSPGWSESNQKRWVNGTLGVVTAFTERGVMVRIGTEAPVEVGPSTWEIVKHKVEEIRHPDTGETFRKLKPKVVATFSQIPLKSAWALTIHKSQGSTYDGVIVDLTGPYTNPGQAYVALSRVRTLDGLSLSTPLTLAQIAVDADAHFFLSSRPVIKASDL